MFAKNALSEEFTFHSILETFDLSHCPCVAEGFGLALASRRVRYAIARWLGISKADGRLNVWHWEAVCKFNLNQKPLWALTEETKRERSRPSGYISCLPSVVDARGAPRPLIRHAIQVRIAIWQRGSITSQWPVVAMSSGNAKALKILMLHGVRSPISELLTDG
jgi:hypothetical protein